MDMNLSLFLSKAEALWTQFPKDSKWLTLFVCLFVGFFIKAVASRLLKGIFFSLNRGSEKLPQKLKNLFIRIDKKIINPLGWLAASLFWLISLSFFQKGEMAYKLFYYIIVPAISFNLVRIGYNLLNYLSKYLYEIASKTDNSLDNQLVEVFIKAAKLFITFIGILLTLQNLGIHVTSLVAGLGIGGLAFALAAKDTIANLFGFTTILIDRPFKVGEFIRIGDLEGVVENLGLRSTRIRTFYKSLVSIPNLVVANEKIDNMGQRICRRTRTTLGLTYGTSPEKLEAFCEKVKAIIQAHPQTAEDQIYVYFCEYGASSLNILVYFYHQVIDWQEELNARHEIFLSILKMAKELNVQFAFPTQSLHIESLPPASGSSSSSSNSPPSSISSPRP